MKLPIVLSITGLVVVAGAGLAYKPAAEYWKNRNRVEWETAEVSRGDILAVVNSTGTIRPVLSVTVGAQVSGPIKQLNVEFNQEVKEGEELARIDPRLFNAAVKNSSAALATSKARIKQIRAQLQQATNAEQRGLKLRSEKETFVSDTEMDQLRFTRQGLEAELEVGLAQVQQAEASLEQAATNLEFTIIRAPRDGVIIDRKIEHGQTLAAQFQAPELFVLAPDLRKEIYVHVSVDESDIGLIRRAQDRGRVVHFTVDAYPDDVFEGSIKEIRLSSIAEQNVVTYPVVVSAPNPELQLLPGMTATVSFDVDERLDVVRIPNSALRFYPDIEQVREEDHVVLEGASSKNQASQKGEDEPGSVSERWESRRNRNRRHVWIQEGEQLRAIAVETGVTDSRFSECLSGELKSGVNLVVRIKPPE
tara:strand:+ start:464 stop:1723 length:1260 start_codon:yes stop_codon:yes gene_type:complete